ncbi:hypothetical protein C8R47DRAFT_1222055 [Mycena vitilis]|nr:hypothetical protein C8R47DRAFT_1084190 [Mycena vitilis]KAJ6464210.1 hypothetical protein C8R47DRAFT_1224914 [Mycena vitilis]KAJ6471798.1 hypothetical protein C8R47DRAFT_1222055 [Mycena vitilis]
MSPTLRPAQWSRTGTPELPYDSINLPAPVLQPLDEQFHSRPTAQALKPAPFPLTAANLQTYSAIEFLPAAPRMLTPGSFHQYQYVSPYRPVKLAPHSRVYTTDQEQRPIRTRIEARPLDNQAMYFTVTNSPASMLRRGSILRVFGDLSGRWEIDSKLSSTDTHILLRINEHHDHLTTILAVSHPLLNFPGPVEQPQGSHDAFACANPGLSSLERMQLAQEVAWSRRRPIQQPLPPPVFLAPQFDYFPQLQWMNTSETPQDVSLPGL